MFRNLILLGLFILPFRVFSKDTLRYISYPKNIHLYIKTGPAYSQLEISNPDLKSSLELAPNMQSGVSFGFNYSWLGIGYSFLLPPREAYNHKYGKTKKNDFVAHLTMRRFMIDLTLNNYKGFYLSNAEDLIKGWSDNQPYPQVPDLKTTSLSASFAYVFKPEKFSAAAAYSYTKSMRRSGGSWMLGGFVSKSGIYSDSTIVPLSIKQYINPEFNLKKINFTELGISFGYSYLLTIRKKYFISVTFLPGVSFQKIRQQSSVDGSYENKGAVSFRQNSHISLGRNGNKYYWGLKSYVESSIIKNQKSELMFQSGNFEFFIGYRLNTDNWKFMKTADKILHPQRLRFITGSPPDRT